MARIPASSDLDKCGWHIDAFCAIFGRHGPQDGFNSMVSHAESVLLRDEKADLSVYHTQSHTLFLLKDKPKLNTARNSGNVSHVNKNINI